MVEVEKPASMEDSHNLQCCVVSRLGSGMLPVYTLIQVPPVHETNLVSRFRIPASTTCINEHLWLICGCTMATLCARNFPTLSEVGHILTRKREVKQKHGEKGFMLASTHSGVSWLGSKERARVGVHCCRKPNSARLVYAVGTGLPGWWHMPADLLAFLSPVRCEKTGRTEQEVPGKKIKLP